MRVSIPFLCSLMLCLTNFSAPISAIEKGANTTFTIGIVSTKPKKRIRLSTPLAEYIADRLPEYDYGTVLVSENVNEMAGLLESGEVSMVAITPYAALLIERQGTAKISALRWKQGVESYHSVIFTRKDSNINTPKDLLGHTIAFEKDSSTSAFFAPSVHLLAEGFKLQKMRSFKDKPDPDKIGYLFINDYLRQSNEVNMSIWVFHKRLDAAAFSHLDWADSETTPNNAKKNMHVIAETGIYPRSVILISPTLSAKKQQALLRVLFEAETHEEGVKVMRSFQKTSRFSPIPDNLNEVLDKARLQLNANPDIYK